jgi:hypothetical protein
MTINKVPQHMTKNASPSVPPRRWAGPGLSTAVSGRLVVGP